SRAFTSRSEDAQSSSVPSIDAPAIHDPPNHGRPWIQKSKENATVVLGSGPIKYLADQMIG
ncbi:MAG TPA: hypothetical protein VFC15_12895, partial [Candidatus Limnocylindrales bacterium]|nr:hypothetical protein [Candidatus Limnocylindrales bacterium]